jgi:hypothetical protein
MVVTINRTETNVGRLAILLGAVLVAAPAPALALPPADDRPEEILRTEIITEARSPLTGEPLSAADYAALMETLRDPNTPRAVNPELAHLIYLLQLRRVVRFILPIF